MDKVSMLRLGVSEWRYKIFSVSSIKNSLNSFFKQYRDNGIVIG